MHKEVNGLKCLVDYWTKTRTDAQVLGSDHGSNMGPSNRNFLMTAVKLFTLNLSFLKLGPQGIPFSLFLQSRVTFVDNPISPQCLNCSEFSDDGRHRMSSVSNDNLSFANLVFFCLFTDYYFFLITWWIKRSNLRCISSQWNQSWMQLRQKKNTRRWNVWKSW